MASNIIYGTCRWRTNKQNRILHKASPLLSLHSQQKLKVPVVFGCLQMQRACVTSLSPKINIRPSVLSAPHIPCKINKEIRPSSNVCHGHVQWSKPARSCLQFVVWASASAALRHATVLQTSSAAVQLSEDSQCTWQSLCEYFVNMYMAHLASLLRVCVCMCVRRWDTTTRQRWCAVSCCCCLNQTLLDPLSFLSPGVGGYKTGKETVTEGKR